MKMTLAAAQQPLRDVIDQIRHNPVTVEHLKEQLTTSRARLNQAVTDKTLRVQQHTELDKELRRIAAHAGMARALFNDPSMPQPSQRGLELLTFATNLLDDMLIQQAIAELL
jgi:hypothetical protein